MKKKWQEGVSVITRKPKLVAEGAFIAGDFLTSNRYDSSKTTVKSKAAAKAWVTLSSSSASQALSTCHTIIKSTAETKVIILNKLRIDGQQPH